MCSWIRFCSATSSDSRSLSSEIWPSWSLLICISLSISWISPWFYHNSCVYLFEESLPFGLQLVDDDLQPLEFGVQFLDTLLVFGEVSFRAFVLFGHEGVGVLELLVISLLVGLKMCDPLLEISDLIKFLPQHKIKPLNFGSEVSLQGLDFSLVPHHLIHFDPESLVEPLHLLAQESDPILVLS